MPRLLPFAGLRTGEKPKNVLPMNVHLVQLDIRWEDPVANFVRVERLLQVSPPAPGALVVLPEMFATGFSLDLSKTCAGPALEAGDFLRALAKRHGVAVLAGVVHRNAAGAVHNEAVAFGPGGELLARYAKQRPFSGAGEDAVHTRGTQPVLFEWDGTKVAPLVCFDLRFPELFREAVRAGAEMFVVIAAWPVARIDHWITLLRARAIENQALVVGVNRTGSEPKFQYCGRSMVVDPHGRVIADAGEEECVIAAFTPSSAAREWRAEFPAVRDFLNAE